MKRKNPKFTKDEELKICEEYKNGLSTLELANKYFCLSWGKIHQILIKNNIKCRNRSDATQKYEIDQNVFNKIDTEEKAYVLGFLFADGGNIGHSIVIALQAADKEILEKIQTLLKTNKPIKYFKKQDKNYVRFVISNKQLVNDLVQLGIVKRKSLILEFPTQNQVPDHLIRHFIRGYYDGDGGLSINFNRNYGVGRVNIVSAKNFLMKLKSFIDKLCVVTSHIVNIPTLKNNNITKRLVINGNLQIIKFLEWLYKDSTIFLNRKYSKFLLLKQLKEKSDSNRKPRNQKSVLIDGKFYQNCKIAAKELKINRKTIKNRCDSSKWNNYSFTN